MKLSGFLGLGYIEIFLAEGAQTHSMSVLGRDI